MGLFDEDTPRWVRLSILGMVAALVGLVAVIVLLVVGLGDDDETADPTDGRRSSGSGEPSTSKCGLPDGDQSIPKTAPAAEWEVVNGIGVPSSPKYGPGVVKDAGKDRSCFAHSPLGAIFFALNGPAGGDQDQSGAEWAGFRILDYSPERVTIDVAIRVVEGPTSGQLVSAPAVVEWSDGDWAQAPESEDVDPVALASLDGFIEFSSDGGSD
jgi:hypothetical protein